MALMNPVPGTITQPYGYDPNYIWNKDRFHYGLDFGTGGPVTVSIPLGGRVIAVGIDGGYGLRVLFEHADGTRTLYAHLSSTTAKVGDYLGTGTPFAISGGGNGDERDGTSTGWHLHFAVMQNGSWIDPQKWLAETDPDNSNPPVYDTEKVTPSDYEQTNDPSLPDVSNPNMQPPQWNDWINPQMWESWFQPQTYGLNMWPQQQAPLFDPVAEMLGQWQQPESQDPAQSFYQSVVNPFTPFNSPTF